MYIDRRSMGGYSHVQRSDVWGYLMTNQISRAAETHSMSIAQMVGLLGEDVRWTSGALTGLLDKVSSLDSASPGAVAFCRYTDDRLDRAVRCDATALIIPATRPTQAVEGGPSLVAVDNPRLSFIRVASRFYEPPLQPGIHPTASVSEGAFVDPTSCIGALVTVGKNCRVGARSVLHSGVHLYPNTSVGDRVILHAGVVVGVDGFGYERDATGKLHKFPHVGGVTIEDDVEVGANCCIARGALDNTVISKGTKLDGLVHVAHNCQVGPDTLLTAQTMLAGSVTIGARVWLSPGCRILNNTTIGDDAVVGMGANVMADVGPGATVVAPPARSPLGRK